MPPMATTHTHDVHDPAATPATPAPVSARDDWYRARRPAYVYVASSWRNQVQPIVCAFLAAAGVEHYDFKNPPGGVGFGWPQVKTIGGPTSLHQVATKGSDWEDVDEYLAMIEHPRAVEGFAADFAAMKRADTFVLVLPCGKSAHLELGWAVGAGKRTAILLEDPVEPELMYRMVDFIARDLPTLLRWLDIWPRDCADENYCLPCGRRICGTNADGYTTTSAHTAPTRCEPTA